jgi:hypothetical protein
MSKESSMSVNDFPEYHELFEAGDGPVTLKVKFISKIEAKGRSFPTKQINWRDVLRLFGGPDGMPFKRMSFDEWPFTVKKIEIDPGRRHVTLVISEMNHTIDQDQ